MATKTKDNPFAPYKSKEELYFTFWLEELKELGVILEWKYEPKTFNLSEPVQRMGTAPKSKKPKILQHYLGKCEYTPDFRVEWNRAYLCKVFTSHLDHLDTKKVPFLMIMEENEEAHRFKPISYFEIKGTQFTVASDTHVRRAWLFQKYQIFTHLAKITLKPDSFFNETFTPKKVLLNEIYQKTSTVKVGKEKVQKQRGDSKILYPNVRTCEEWLKTL